MEATEMEENVPGNHAMRGRTGAGSLRKSLGTYVAAVLSTFKGFMKKFMGYKLTQV